jgi:hypothetical protein
MEYSNHTAASLSPIPPSAENIKVFLRLRPKNKFEAMKRSKDCIRLHENPNDITVESPLLGEFQFSFDQVSFARGHRRVVVGQNAFRSFLIPKVCGLGL